MAQVITESQVPTDALARLRLGGLRGGEGGVHRQHRFCQHAHAFLRDRTVILSQRVSRQIHGIGAVHISRYYRLAPLVNRGLHCRNHLFYDGPYVVFTCG